MIIDVTCLTSYSCRSCHQNISCCEDYRAANACYQNSSPVDAFLLPYLPLQQSSMIEKT